ncbi:hypothetical protein H696_03123 [Fonticula alba]|uniref:L-serine ammonia-lyase n=1 Tax=Fonticula alba TaxID=691883 RepID=A0A058ZBG9_FONAL|nr:hypothetical protein H696_03123 [Fonticula alba]KCV70772.1 hypothetical protein H696_03123 [Fonticula alba]|eukprot:XP_009495288.1 hypothetical protein H696_03123 [Fonticula alba]
MIPARFLSSLTGVSRSSCPSRLLARSAPVVASRTFAGLAGLAGPASPPSARRPIRSSPSTTPQLGLFPGAGPVTSSAAFLSTPPRSLFSTSAVAGLAGHTGDSSSPQALDEKDNHAVISVFDMFSIGIGPSSSHTVGPMRAARMFITSIEELGILHDVRYMRVELYGSLALTGDGHGTPDAVLMGLEGEDPRTVDTTMLPARVASIRSEKRLNLLGGLQLIDFDPSKHLIYYRDKRLPQHPNGMRFSVFNADGDLLATNEYFSVGGGFIVNKDTELAGENAFYRATTALPLNPSASYTSADEVASHGPASTAIPLNACDSHTAHHHPTPVCDMGKKNAVVATLPFRTGDELLELCRQQNMTIAAVVMENERRWRPEAEIRANLLEIWRAMDDSITNGCWSSERKLPGSAGVSRRAPALFRRLMAKSMPVAPFDPTSPHGRSSATPSSAEGGHARARRDLPTMAFLDWLSCFAIAVNEENAAGGRVVTAPTNGAAGIIPAVLKYFVSFVAGHAGPDAAEEDIVEFLLTAGAIGMLYKRGASISAAEVGCQGEVGVACSMAAAGLAAVMGGTIDQVENAAEIGMEHNLGLTCDPVAGLVQIPCIERNALGAAKAVTAAQLALSGDGQHRVTLDQVIETMRQTGLDMQSKYKETSLGGLAVNVPVC